MRQQNRRSPMKITNLARIVSERLYQNAGRDTSTPSAPPSDGRLPLRRSSSTHDGPCVDDGFAAHQVDAIVHIDAGIQVRGVNLDALPQLDVPAAFVPQQHAVFGASAFDAHAGAVLHLID